jgi:hypothetical protein
VTRSPEVRVWAWYRPPQFPDGVIFKLTPEVWHPNFAAHPLSLRQLLCAIDVELATVSAWFLYGVPYDAMAGNSPFFDQPIPPPLPGIEPDIAVRIVLQQASADEGMPPPTDMIQGPDTETLFDTIESDWTSTVKMERQMLLVRKQLSAMMIRLNALNRDLSPDERMYGDRQDKSDWQEARRWLRESATRLSRCIKQHDVGETSMAGKRDWFEEIIEHVIAPKRPIENLPQIQREFEANRKRYQSLLNTMMASLAEASQEGERRATTILSRFAAKVRQGLTPKPRS